MPPQKIGHLSTPKITEINQFKVLLKISLTVLFQFISATQLIDYSKLKGQSNGVHFTSRKSDGYGIIYKMMNKLNCI